MRCGHVMWTCERMHWCQRCLQNCPFSPSTHGVNEGCCRSYAWPAFVCEMRESLPMLTGLNQGVQGRRKRANSLAAKSYPLPVSSHRLLPRRRLPRPRRSMPRMILSHRVSFLMAHLSSITYHTTSPTMSICCIATPKHTTPPAFPRRGGKWRVCWRVYTEYRVLVLVSTSPSRVRASSDVAANICA